MPELPEIETVKRTLLPLIQQKRFFSVEIRNPVVIKYPSADVFIKNLVGKQIVDVRRCGKYLKIILEDASILVVHLRMTGRITCVNKGTPELQHTHIVFDLGTQQLRYSDVRRFGGLWYLAPQEEDHWTGMQNLGMEPFSSSFSGTYLYQALQKRRSAIKSAIMDQHIIAGLGNIYADESLFACRIHPLRKCCEITEEEWDTLASEIPVILQDSIERGGTSFSDYLDADGRKGNNQFYLRAYQRNGLPCFRCGTMMQKIRVGGRGTCFCPNCQK